MKAVRISTIIIFLLFFINQNLLAEKIYCKKYSGTFKEYTLNILFAKNGKMLIEVVEKDGGGCFSTPGSYTVKDLKIDFFYRGLMRSILMGDNHISATPYTFNIDEDYKTIILLKEDKSFISSCK